MRIVGLIGAALLALVACDAAETAPGPDSSAAADVALPQDTSGLSTDSGEEVHFSPSDPDAVEDTIGVDAGPDVSGCSEAGEIGCPCVGPADCQSGYCIASRAGQVCTRPCVDDCPAGWGCKQDLQSKPDVKFICVPLDLLLCAPCATTQDCADAAIGLAGACVPHGDDGAFCATACSAAACPDGFTCTTTAGMDSKVADLCLPTSGDCGCSAYAELIGASTACARSTADGSCPGVRQCKGGALSPCDAPEPAAEACNGEDDDCDGKTDEGLDGAPCEATSELGSCAGTLSCTGGKPVCDAPQPKPETCNGLDDDCDGQVDEGAASGCKTFWRDEDTDGFGKSGDSVCACAPLAPYTAGEGGDCNDLEPSIFTGAVEGCNGKDDDCNGGTDDGVDLPACTEFYPDADGDGWGTGATTKCLCTGAAPYTALKTGDCNDADGAVRPDTTEECNGKDDDCDGAIDEEGAAGCTAWFKDADGDGYGLDDDWRCACGKVSGYTAVYAGDCNDKDFTVHPDVWETCNGKDDDCDGTADPAGSQGCEFWFTDEDGDGAGALPSKCLCQPTPPFVAPEKDDCYDKNPYAVPGQTGWFTKHRGDGSFDYDCNKIQEPHWSGATKCDVGCVGTAGWATTGGQNPACGATADWSDGCWYNPFACTAFLCCDETVERTQECR